MVLPLAGAARHPAGSRSVSGPLASEDQAGRQEAGKRGPSRDPGGEQRQGGLPCDHQREGARPSHRAPEPVRIVVNVLTQIARSITSERCRRYQRSYESLSAVPSASAV